MVLQFAGGDGLLRGMRASAAIPLLAGTFLFSGCFDLPKSSPAVDTPCDGGICAVPHGFGTPCQSAADCLSSICLPDGTGTNRCSAQCRNATECPNGWACNSGACECGGALCENICLDLTTDPSNCGACGRVCSADPTTTPFCTEGTCAEELTAPPNSLVTGLTAGAGEVVWTDSTSLFVLGETGGVLYSPASGGSGPIIDLVVEGSELFWGTSGQLSFARISGVALPSGMTDISLGAQQVGQTGLTFMIADSTNVYWIDQNVRSPGLFQTTLTGGAIVSLATSPEQATGLTVQGQRVYWSLQQSGKVLSVPIGGGQPSSLLGTGPSDAVRMTSDARNIYLLDGTSTSIVAISIQGGTATTIVSSTTEISDVTSDGTNLYWSEPTAGILMRAPITGGIGTVIASGQASPLFLAVDGDFLYWANEGGGIQNGSNGTSINRIPRE